MIEYKQTAGLFYFKQQDAEIFCPMSSSRVSQKNAQEKKKRFTIDIEKSALYYVHRPLREYLKVSNVVGKFGGFYNFSSAALGF
jgi:hypothetical protein